MCCCCWFLNFWNFLKFSIFFFFFSFLKKVWFIVLIVWWTGVARWKQPFLTLKFVFIYIGIEKLWFLTIILNSKKVEYIDIEKPVQRKVPGHGDKTYPFGVLDKFAYKVKKKKKSLNFTKIKLKIMYRWLAAATTTSWLWPQHVLKQCWATPPLPFTPYVIIVHIYDIYGCYGVEWCLFVFRTTNDIRNITERNWNIRSLIAKWIFFFLISENFKFFCNV